MAEKETDQKKSKIAEREEKTLKFWQESKIFERTLAKGGEEFVFYDGPPFATGSPHFGHILAGTIKDVIPRYQTMRGKHVARRWGWDCHGLPVENLVEKELGLATKKEIEKFGIAEFNARAKASVLRYEEEWKEIIPRTGRWVDMENAYTTMDASYTESVWWSFKKLYNDPRKLIYQGWMSMHLCPRCETTLSNFEVNQGYKDITDISVYVKFELAAEPGTYLLAWTTTPWTLPGNAALAVKSDGVYVKAKKGGENFILLKNLAEKVLKDGYEVVEEILGEKLKYLKYKPVFDYYKQGLLKDVRGRDLDPRITPVWSVLTADFVSTEEGTGIVHIAPAFGEEDYQLAGREGLPFIKHVGTDGRFEPEVTDFAGELVKPKDDHQATDIKIIKYLVGKNLLFAKEKIVHSYPHCWRCDTPLLNYASSSWFLKVTDEKLKNKLLTENKKIAWVPEDIRDGRFGKWLEGARDWAISRSRYWGAPLPVWKCENADCGKEKVIGGLDELKEFLPKSGNKYFLMRHGEAESNITNSPSYKSGGTVSLTERGRKQTEKAVEKLASKKITKIYSSPFLRCKETAEIIAEKLGLKKGAIVYDSRLEDLNVGEFEGKTWDDYFVYFKDQRERFTKAPPGGENLTSAKHRVGAAIYDIEQQNKDEKILIIGHGLSLWMLAAVAEGADVDQTIDIRTRDQAASNMDYIANAEVRDLSFSPLPHNQEFELDLHRPYIDEVKFKCDCGAEMTRVPEVFDTWYDSGSVSFASRHARDLVPADFIAEGLDQTRGWFYTMLVLGTALFDRSPYKQVVVNGLVLAEDGKKMSKRLKNYPELTDVLDKYGADALRYYLIASPLVRAEDSAFSEKGLAEVLKKIILRLENVVAFYELYKQEAGKITENKAETSENILDQWILARLAQLNHEVTGNLDNYELDQAGRPIALFVDDLSTWYLRRSRKRPEALPILRHVLVEFAKILAPFMPFLAEDIYQRLGDKERKESVHLEQWPEAGAIDEKLIAEMAEVRKIVSLGMEQRARAEIKVRQPLANLSVGSEISGEYHEIIKDELNVKKITFDQNLTTELELETKLTDDLREEGELRDLVRLIQDARKEAGLLPGELAILTANPVKRELIDKYKAELMKTCALAEVIFDETCLTISIIRKG